MRPQITSLFSVVESGSNQMRVYYNVCCVIKLFWYVWQIQQYVARHSSTVQVVTLQAPTTLTSTL